MKPNIIFDFDGTLIDSATSILASLKLAFSSHGIHPVVPLEPGLIGPPLRDTLAKLLGGSADQALLDELSVGFKRFYDSEGYKATEVFPGVSELLADLSRRENPMYIATNKRLYPTLLILEHLGWDGLFRGVYALDAMPQGINNKSAMLGYILEQNEIIPQEALYVGDKPEDGKAADDNSLPFIAACWGYGAFGETEIYPHWRPLYYPSELLVALVDAGFRQD